MSTHPQTELTSDLVFRTFFIYLINNKQVTYVCNRKITGAIRNQTSLPHFPPQKVVSGGQTLRHVYDFRMYRESTISTRFHHAEIRDSCFLRLTTM